MSEQKKKSKGQLSREKIITTTLNMIYEKGYSETSAQDIADLCGISQATIFYHFKTKQKLFVEILYFVIQNNRDIYQEMNLSLDTPRKKLKALLTANMKWALNFPEQMNIILLLFNFASFDQQLKVVADEIILAGQQTVKDALMGHDISINMKLDDLAVTLQQYANGVMFQAIATTNPQKTFDTFEKNLDVFLDSLL